MMYLILALMMTLATGTADASTPNPSNPEKKESRSFGNAYIDLHWPVADSLSKVYGIPASVILSVAVIESGNGSSRNAKLLKNHFGIKGKNRLQSTHGIYSAYKQYGAVADSYADFCKIISRKKFYPSLKGNSNPDTWVMAISKAGYSTQPADWRSKINNALRAHFK